MQILDETLLASHEPIKKPTFSENDNSETITFGTVEILLSFLHEFH